MTHETYKINYKFDCSKKCPIYLLTCKQCWKQYVRQTKDNFPILMETIIKIITENIKVLKNVCRNLFRLFSGRGQGRFLNDRSITFIDKIDPSDPLKREDCWRRTLKTMTPFGLNVEDSVWSIIMVTMHLDNAVVLDCFKGCDFQIMDIFTLFLLLLHLMGWRLSPFAKNFHTGKSGGKACVLCCVYLFIYYLFIHIFTFYLL